MREGTREATHVQNICSEEPAHWVHGVRVVGLRHDHETHGRRKERTA